MTDRPMIFQGWGVRAIRNRLKTQTRRVGRDQEHRPVDQDEEGWYWQVPVVEDGFTFHDRVHVPCPYGVPGDRLYISEQIEFLSVIPSTAKLRYFADGLERTVVVPDRVKMPKVGPWRGRILPPEWARPERLPLTDVRVQRVQEISREDALAEGILTTYNRSQSPPVPWYTFAGAPFQWVLPEVAFHHFWDSINAKRGFGWDANDWVWALTFEVCDADDSNPTD